MKTKSDGRARSRRATCRGCARSSTSCARSSSTATSSRRITTSITWSNTSPTAASVGERCKAAGKRDHARRPLGQRRRSAPSSSPSRTGPSSTQAAGGAQLHQLLVRLPRRERGAADARPHRRAFVSTIGAVAEAAPGDAPWRRNVNRLRVLYLQPATDFGGAERQATYLMAGLPRHGIEVVPLVGPGRQLVDELAGSACAPSTIAGLPLGRAGAAHDARARRAGVATGCAPSST